MAFEILNGGGSQGGSGAGKFVRMDAPPMLVDENFLRWNGATAVNSSSTTANMKYFPNPYDNFNSAVRLYGGHSLNNMDIRLMKYSGQHPNSGSVAAIRTYTKANLAAIAPTVGMTLFNGLVVANNAMWFQRPSDGKAFCLILANTGYGSGGVGWGCMYTVMDGETGALMKTGKVHETDLGSSSRRYTSSESFRFKSTYDEIIIEWRNGTTSMTAIGFDMETFNLTTNYVGIGRAEQNYNFNTLQLDEYTQVVQRGARGTYGNMTSIDNTSAQAPENVVFVRKNKDGISLNFEIPVSAPWSFLPFPTAKTNVGTSGGSVSGDYPFGCHLSKEYIHGISRRATANTGISGGHMNTISHSLMLWRRQDVIDWVNAAILTIYGIDYT